MVCGGRTNVNGSSSSMSTTSESLFDRTLPARSIAPRFSRYNPCADGAALPVGAAAGSEKRVLKSLEIAPGSDSTDTPRRYSVPLNVKCCASTCALPAPETKAAPVVSVRRPVMVNAASDSTLKVVETNFTPSTSNVPPEGMVLSA